ncbi:MAG: NTP transferase domain-containing protein, partial [Saprospiraceae bacterium]|nr:NTP transferase domain-containing protein [Saprospiraceae bacterium]
EQVKSTYPVVEDSFAGLGPFGGIVSAFRHDPNRAWMTLPCDVPLVDKALLKELASHRNPGKLATCFYNPATEFPEPLITIWEPRAYPVLLQFLSQGYSCPRKVLINSEVEVVKTGQAEKLMNVNTQEERQRVIDLLRKS